MSSFAAGFHMAYYLLAGGAINGFGHAGPVGRPSGITHADDAAKRDEIRALVVKLGGDPEAVFFGAYDKPQHDGADMPVPEYPLDETDEG